MGVLGGLAFSYERGTPVGFCGSGAAVELFLSAGVGVEDSDE